MIRAVESCHAWLEEIAWHIKVTPNAFEQPSVGARIAFVKVQAARVRVYTPRYFPLTTILLGLGTLCTRKSTDLWRVGNLITRLHY